MAVTDWSVTPALNISINGINIAENCPPGNLNNAVRAVMASVRVAFNGIPSTANFITKTGGVFTGNPTYSGRGGYYHSVDPTMTSGRITIQAEGASLPAGAPGDIVFSY